MRTRNKATGAMLLVTLHLSARRIIASVKRALHSVSCAEFIELFNKRRKDLDGAAGPAPFEWRIDINRAPRTPSSATRALRPTASAIYQQTPDSEPRLEVFRGLRSLA